MAVIVEGAPGNVSISWSTPSEPNGVIVHYDIMCTSGQGQNVNDRRVGSMSMNSITLYGLTPATRYTCTVTASTSAEGGPPGMDDVLTRMIFKVVSYVFFILMLLYPIQCQPHPQSQQ